MTMTEPINSLTGALAALLEIPHLAELLRRICSSLRRSDRLTTTGLYPWALRAVSEIDGLWIKVIDGLPGRRPASGGDDYALMTRLKAVLSKKYANSAALKSLIASRLRCSG
jgi:hypothetical protein